LDLLAVQDSQELVMDRKSGWLTQVQSLGQEDPLEKEMAAHFIILAWEIPWTEIQSGMGKNLEADHGDGSTTTWMQ